jgi:hypothetical protein
VTSTKASVPGSVDFSNVNGREVKPRIVVTARVGGERDRAELAAFEKILVEALAAALLARASAEREEQASREKAAAEEQAVVVSPTISQSRGRKSVRENRV